MLKSIGYLSPVTIRTNEEFEKKFLLIPDVDETLLLAAERRNDRIQYVDPDVDMMWWWFRQGSEAGKL